MVLSRPWGVLVLLKGEVLGADLLSCGLNQKRLSAIPGRAPTMSKLPLT